MVTTDKACTYCLCTDTTPCEHGCSWVEDPAGRTICSSCADSEDATKTIVAVFAQLGPRLRPPSALASPAWTDLTAEQQQLLVMAHKRRLEAEVAAMSEHLNDEAIGALQGMHAIVTFIHQRAPEQLEQDTPIADVVTALLEPHLGNRIVLPNAGLTL